MRTLSINNSLKGLVLVGIFMSLTSTTDAQQVTQFTKYAPSKVIINPANTGLQERKEAYLGYRKQWMGFGQGPGSLYMSFSTGFRKKTEKEHYPLALRTSRNPEQNISQKEEKVSKIKHGLGGYILSDQFGAFRNNSINLVYAMHLPVGKKFNFSWGVNAGFDQARFDATKAVTEQSGDGAYDVFSADRNGLSRIHLDLGFQIYSEDFYVGYATQQLTKDALAFSSLNDNQVLKQHHIITAGYNYEVNPDFKLKPTLVMRNVAGVPANMDVLVNGEFNNTLIGGLGYRTGDALLINLGYRADDKYQFGYSYDLTLSGLRGFGSGAHEITLGAFF